ncbi:TIGR03943 family protein [Oscillatoria sp. CS-180]|uniref:TIGR03943 family putative permease subunit n=1 Tax=Oscillatoria sp. CS-180 TaxID=3021720 RepID=UPI00232A7E4C|nr:TIGR03943 family protein [Oscillatoria sp. CS-180]MDB9527546.1 TIGR03943 family protein [Oscillatoria sp. CS-180]
MKKSFPWSIVLDVLALLLWGLMILRYWWTGRLAVLLHPDYHWLAIGAGWTLLFLAIWRSISLFKSQRRGSNLPHIALMPRQWSLAILLAVAVFGIIYVPRPFASDAALARGIADPVALTRSQPRRFVRSTPPEERSLIDWIRTLNVYPEPDAYTDDPVSVTGFVIHPPDWDDYLMVARFVLTCCAADAYPVGLPVELTGDHGNEFPADSWISVRGKMTTETIDGQRRLLIQPDEIISIPEPDNPYEF